MRANVSALSLYRFNRTFMELKHRYNLGFHLHWLGFNRTFMELKLIKKCSFWDISITALIGPLWN